MPVVFGPTCGPREGPEGNAFDCSGIHRITATVSFLSSAVALEALLPRGFNLVGDPLVTVECTNYRELPWLAGRGYNTLGVKVPARFEGQKDAVTGSFLTVLWENMCEPILSGREELGYAKLYCELPEPRVGAGRRTHTAHWDGHTFMTMELTDLRDDGTPPPIPSGGTLHHRYFPAVNELDRPEVEGTVFSPAGGFASSTLRYERGSGAVEFHRATWSQMPTMFHIVNSLAALPVLELRGASLLEARGMKDLSDQRVLR